MIRGNTALTKWSARPRVDDKLVGIQWKGDNLDELKSWVGYAGGSVRVLEDGALVIAPPNSQSMLIPVLAAKSDWVCRTLNQMNSPNTWDFMVRTDDQLHSRYIGEVI